MVKEKRVKFGSFEKNNNFVDRVLFLSVPSGLVFIMLAICELITPGWAVISYGVIILFNVVLLLPMTLELQSLKRYINDLAKGENFEEKALAMSEQESKEIIQAVNAMHTFWASRADELEARAISDAAVLDTLPDPILMLDRAGNIIGANLSARTLFGDYVTDKNVENLFDSNNFIAAATKILKKESDSENLIFYVKKPIHQKLYAHIKSLPWLSKGRAVAVISLYDLTKSMKIEKMQSDFVANASHELRTPLSIISGFIETLLTSAKDDKAAQENFLKIMQQQTEYMSALIENLLSLSRIEMQQDERPEEKVKVVKIVEDVIAALSQKASEREINLKMKLDDTIPTIIADNRQVKQVIQNLTDNAIKYGTSQSDITIRLDLVEKIPGSKSVNVAEGKAIAVSINNKGPKITPENLTRLTERFYRLQEHKNLNIKGTGLGLAIAKHIIMRHRGNLTVTSTNYNGTTFTIYLPVEQ